jgi:hypothetical protein
MASRNDRPFRAGLRAAFGVQRLPLGQQGMDGVLANMRGRHCAGDELLLVASPKRDRATLTATARLASRVISLAAIWKQESISAPFCRSTLRPAGSSFDGLRRRGGRPLPLSRTTGAKSHRADRAIMLAVIVAVSVDGGGGARSWPWTSHGGKPHSTDPLERHNDETKRRSEIVGVFPNDAAIARPVGALPLEQDDEWAVRRARYMTLESIAPLSDDPSSRCPSGQRDQPAQPRRRAGRPRRHRRRPDEASGRLNRRHTLRDRRGRSGDRCPSRVSGPDSAPPSPAIPPSPDRDRARVAAPT